MTIKYKPTASNLSENVRNLKLLENVGFQGMTCEAIKPQKTSYLKQFQG